MNLVELTDWEVNRVVAALKHQEQQTSNSTLKPTLKAIELTNLVNLRAKFGSED